MTLISTFTGPASVVLESMLLVTVLALVVSGRPDGFSGIPFEMVPFDSRLGVNFKPSPKVHLQKETFGDDFLMTPARSKRDPEHHVSGCVYMTSEEGEFYYKAMEHPDGKPCGIYIFGDPDQNIEITFNYLDVSCENQGLVVVVDGWELNGELFPSPDDHPHPIKSRFNEICGRRKVKQSFVSSQNVALIQYRMPSRGSSFSFNVKFVKNPAPCNVLFQLDDIYTLRNFDKRSNCSVSTLFPAAVKVLNLNVGVTPSFDRRLQFETGKFYKVRSECQKRGLEDYVQIGGSPGLDNANMQIADSVCGLSSRPERHIDFIGCGTTTVRLVSSGAFDNSITISFRGLTDNDVNAYMSVICLSEDSLEK